MSNSVENPQPSDHRPYAEDEISLVDLAVSLWQHKWVIVGVTVLCTLAGLAYALSKERVYEFTTTIEIGTRLVDAQVRAIEPSHNVIAKLENTYVPESIRLYQEELQQEDGRSHRLTVNVRSPRDTDLVILTSTGPEELGKFYIPLQNRILARLVEDHERDTELERTRLENELQQARIRMEELEDERVLRVERNRLENKISEAENKLASLEDQEKLLTAELENLTVQEELIRNRLNELEEFVAQARERRARAQQQAQGGTDSMALMLIDNELQRDIDRQTTLEERLLVELPETRANLRSSLEDNQRQQRLQSETINALEGELEKLVLDQEREQARHRPEVRELEIRLSNLRETRAILPPRQSLNPVGTSRALIVALSMILGGVLGIFAVGLLILAKSTREQLGK